MTWSLNAFPRLLQIKHSCVITANQALSIGWMQTKLDQQKMSSIEVKQTSPKCIEDDKYIGWCFYGNLHYT